MMKTDGVVISLLDYSTDISLKGIPSSILKQSETRIIFENISKRFQNKEDSVITLNAGDENGIKGIHLPSSFDFSSIAAVPLFAKREIIGGLTVLFKRPHTLTAQEEELMAAIGHQIGNALGNFHSVPPSGKG
jgi:GAF domain-containing protein